MQTRDEVRTEVQNQIRDAVRDATNAARDAAREVEGVVVQTPATTTPIDGNFVLDVLRGEIAATRSTIEQLNTQLDRGTGRDRAGIEGQLTVANARLERLQERLDQLVAGESVETFTEVPSGLPPGFDGDRIESIARMATETVFFTIVALAIGIPLVRAFARWLDRRGTPAPAADLGGRFDRIEQALDTVAVEVERIAEGQRYSSRLLSELRALPAPDALPQWGQRPRDAERIRHTTPV
jgi:hypothetical protein